MVVAARLVCVAGTDMGRMLALTLAIACCLVCGVTCILKESSKLAGWLAVWLAGRLLRSAVMFALMKQYGHVLLIVI